MTLPPRHYDRRRDYIIYVISEYVFPAFLLCWAVGVWGYILVFG